jgi:ERCC4-type nuclease
MKRRKAKRENKKRKTRRVVIDEAEFANAVIRKLKGEYIKWNT